MSNKNHFQEIGEQMFKEFSSFKVGGNRHWKTPDGTDVLDTITGIDDKYGIVHIERAFVPSVLPSSIDIRFVVVKRMT